MQTVHGSHLPQHGGAPTHSLPRKFIEPILSLGDRMVHLGPGMREARMMLRELAEAAGLGDYAHQHWFRDLDERGACELLQMDTAKRGALVVLTLLMKVGPDTSEVHRNYFTHIRTHLGAEPVKVPVSLEEHKRLALGFLGH